MNTRTPQKRSRFLSARGIPSMLILVVLALLATGSQPVIHVHHDKTAGIYDVECPLLELSANHEQTVLPAAPPSVRVGAVIGVVLLAAIGDHSAPVAPHADPRAPPLS